ncbi:MAG: kynureninase [Vicingaceae bacterium]
MIFSNTEQFAAKTDENDKLSSFRNQYVFPQHEGKNKIYFTGNSLGLMPKEAQSALNQELEDWGLYGVDGHFEAKNPWVAYHEMFKAPLAKIVGAKEKEVTALGGLTGNLHFLMVSFYQPKGKRIKILCEGKAFPSDQYALESQVKFHGFTKEEAIVEIFPREGEHHLREEDIYKEIEAIGDELALIMIGGVNYYTGQLMPMKKITELGHQYGAIVGFDLAHAAGNVKLELHDWEVDFAAWCSYKYLNSGPGSVAGIYVHQKHGKNNKLNRFAGWWGTPPEDRFLMKESFEPAEGADGWQLSNAPVLAMAVHKVAIDLHLKAGIDNLLEKQRTLTAYLEFVLAEISNETEGVNFEIITPKSRGSQLSILTHGSGKKLFNSISEKGVVADWREPNVIRVAPVPIYNSYLDVFRFGQIISESLAKK